MKKIYSLSLLTIASFSFGQTYIPFTGTGALNANGWTTHSGTAGQIANATTPSDSGNSLSYPGLATSSGNRAAMVAGNSEDVNYPLTAPITSGFVYYSALIKVLDAAQLDANSTTGSYGLSLTSVVGSGTTAFQARIYTKQGTAAGTFVVGILNNSGGTAAPSFITNDLTVNTTYLLVVKFDLATNTASLFVNPTPGAAEPTASITNATGTTAAPTQIAGFVIREVGTATVGSGNVDVDEIRVASTWAEVTPESSMFTNKNTISGLNIYPNPVTNGTLYINSDSNAERTVAVFDVLGKQVLRGTTSTGSINVSNLNTGVYMLQITEEGKTATRKLVIQ